MLVYIFVILCFLICLRYKTKRFLHMLQQNLYNENNRYLKWVNKNRDQFYDIDLIGIGLTIIGLALCSNFEMASTILFIIIGMLYLILAFSWRKRLIIFKIKNLLLLLVELNDLL